MSARQFIERAIEHLPSLLRTGRRLTGSQAEAEDLAQETLARALERRTELRDPASLRGWLLAVQRSLFLNGRRGLRRRFEVIDGGRTIEPVGDLEAEVTRTLDHGLDDALRAALDALPEEFREALWLREVEELSYDEIAQVQGCPPGTVRSRLARARAALAERLGDEEETVDARVQR